MNACQIVANSGVDHVMTPKDTLQIAYSVLTEQQKKRFEQQENYLCRQNLVQPVPDPNYTVRVWRAVVTYLLRRQEFL